MSLVTPNDVGSAISIVNPTFRDAYVLNHTFIVIRNLSVEGEKLRGGLNALLKVYDSVIFPVWLPPIVITV